MRGWLKRGELLLQQPVNTWFTLRRGKQLTSSFKLHHTLQCSLAFRDLRQNWSSVLSTKRSVSGRKGLSSAWSKGCLLRAWLVSAAPENPPLVTKLEPMWEKLPSFQLWIKPRSLTSPVIQCTSSAVIQCSARYFTVAIHVQLYILRKAPISAEKFIHSRRIHDMCLKWEILFSSYKFEHRKRVKMHRKV